MLSYISALQQLTLRPLVCTTAAARLLHMSPVNEAARKGTREKAKKKKVKVEVKKIGFIPHNMRGKDKLKLSLLNKHIDDSWKAVSPDDVYIGRYYRWPVYTIQQAIQCHRETHHPTMYNRPQAPLNVEIELNMVAEKATRFVDNISRMAMIPHKFDHGDERKIIAFVKGQDLVQEARDAGATLAGGVELIKDLQSGQLDIAAYDHIIAHPNILPEMVTLRGLMKRKFPNPKNGTLGTNVGELVQKFSNGIQYSVVKDENQQDYGLIATSVGTLDMDAAHLEANLVSLLKDVDSVRPKRAGRFVTRVLLKSPPSSELLKIDPFVHIPETIMQDAAKAAAAEEEELEQQQRAAEEAVN